MAVKVFPGAFVVPVKVWWPGDPWTGAHRFITNVFWYGFWWGYENRIQSEGFALRVPSTVVIFQKGVDLRDCFIHGNEGSTYTHFEVVRTPGRRYRVIVWEDCLGGLSGEYRAALCLRVKTFVANPGVNTPSIGA